MGSYSFIVCVCVWVRGCLTPPGCTAECRRGHLLSLGVSPLLSVRAAVAWSELGTEKGAIQTFSSTKIFLYLICWLATSLWDLAWKYLTTSVDNARKG